MGGGGTLDADFRDLTTKETGSSGFDRDTDSLEAISETLALVAAASGPAQNLLSQANLAGKAERGARLNFRVVLYDRTTGLLIPFADIDITGITALIGKSTGGNFSGGGLTAIVFAKVVGGFESQYLFVDGEWPDDGSGSYRVEVSGVTALVDGNTVDVPTYTWSAAVGEEGDAKAALDGLIVDAGTGFTSVDGKQDVAQGDLDTLTDRPVSKTLATRAAADIGAAEVEITNTTQHTDATRDALILAVIKAAAMDVGAANITIRIEKDGVQVASDTIAKKTGAAVFEAQLRFNLLVEASEVLRAFIESDNPSDTVATTSAEFFEVG